MPILRNGCNAHSRVFTKTSEERFAPANVLGEFITEAMAYNLEAVQALPEFAHVTTIALTSVSHTITFLSANEMLITLITIYEF